MFSVSNNYDIREHELRPGVSLDDGLDWLPTTTNIEVNSKYVRPTRKEAEDLRDRLIDQEIAELREEAKKTNLRLRFLNQVKIRINGA